MAGTKTLVWTICLYKNADMDEAEFHRYLSEHHGPMVKEVMLKHGIEQYTMVFLNQSQLWSDNDTQKDAQYDRDERTSRTNRHAAERGYARLRSHHANTCA